MGSSNAEEPRVPKSCKVGLGKNQRFNVETFYEKILDRLRKCVLNSFTASVEKHARVSVYVIKLVSIAQVFVNAEDTVPKIKRVNCYNHAFLP